MTCPRDGPRERLEGLWSEPVSDRLKDLRKASISAKQAAGRSSGSLKDIGEGSHIPLPKGKRVIEDFMVQWRKMKEALERQQERLKAEFEDEALKTEYQSRIGQLIKVMEELLSLHGTRTSAK